MLYKNVGHKHHNAGSQTLDVTCALVAPLCTAVVAFVVHDMRLRHLKQNPKSNPGRLAF